MLKILYAVLLSVTLGFSHAEISSGKLTQLTDAPESLKGSFQQEKTLKQFDATVLSSGIFEYQRGQFIRWVTKSPIENEVLMTADEIISRQGTQALLKIDTNKNVVAKTVSRIFFIVLTADWDAVSEIFYVEGTENKGHWSMLLTPKDTSLSQAIKAIKLTGDNLLRSVRIYEANGDETYIKLSGLSQ